MTMPRLYLRFYVALLGSLVVFAVAAALIFHYFSAPPERFSGFAGTIIQNALPPATAPAGEQQADDQNQPRPTFRTGTNLVRVDVTVMDKSGRPVRNLTADDFGGPQLEGCNEILGVTRPDVIERFHRTYCELGVDVIETNTFGAFSVPLNEYGLGDRDQEISRANAAIARAVADEYGIWVAGSIGPGTKFASLPWSMSSP